MGQQPAAMVVATATTTSTVESVDADARTVTLKNPDGTVNTYKLTKDVTNFDQIHPGDQVQATLLDAMAVYVRKAGTPPSAGERGMVALAPKGAKPGVVMADTKEVTDKIDAIDTTKQTITLQGVDGKPQTLKVGPNVDLADLKKGDDVIVRYTQAMAITVAKP